MDQEPSLERSRRTEVLHLGETRLDVIPESKRGWHMRKPNKRSDPREQFTKVDKLLLVETMLEKRLVFLPSSSRGSFRPSTGAAQQHRQIIVVELLVQLNTLLHVHVRVQLVSKLPTPSARTSLHLAFDITSYPTPIEVTFLLTNHFIIYKTSPFSSCFLLTDASGSIETEVIL